MAIISEVEEEEEEKQNEKKSSLKKQENSTLNSSDVKAPANAFAFWFYFVVAVSIVTFLVVIVSKLMQKDEKSWFMSLPSDLHLHFSRGKMIKTQINRIDSPIEVFAIDQGPRDAETILIIHGFACNSYSFSKIVNLLGSSGFRAVAIDIPGSGFSDKFGLEEDKKWIGIFGWIWDIYCDIKEKGLFWGFDLLIETGSIPYEENKVRVSTSKSMKPLKLFSQEMNQIIGQVINSLDLAPLHIVLHDSSPRTVAGWISENPGSIRSITLVDSSSKSTAFPSWILEWSVIREIGLTFSSIYARLIRFCCSNSIERSVLDAHRILLKGRDGHKAVLRIEKGMNSSFDLSEWAGSEVAKDIPFQILWSRDWSEKWSDEGNQVSKAIPQAKFFNHSGSRWSQVDAPDEIVKRIMEFVSSFPKTKRHTEQASTTHIHANRDQECGTDHRCGHGHYGYHESHDHHQEGYGFGHGWVS